MLCNLPRWISSTLFVKLALLSSDPSTCGVCDPVGEDVPGPIDYIDEFSKLNFPKGVLSALLPKFVEHILVELLISILGKGEDTILVSRLKRAYLDTILFGERPCASKAPRMVAN